MTDRLTETEELSAKLAEYERVLAHVDGSKA